MKKIHRNCLLFIAGVIPLLFACGHSIKKSEHPNYPSVTVNPSTEGILRLDETYAKILRQLVDEINRDDTRQNKNLELEGLRKKYAYLMAGETDFEKQEKAIFYTQEAILFAASVKVDNELSPQSYETLYKLVTFFGLETNPQLLTASVIPVLANPSTDVRTMTREVQNLIESQQGLDKYAAYKSHIGLCRMNGKEMPDALINSMILRNPKDGIQTMTEVMTPYIPRHEERSLKWAAHLTSLYLWRKQNEFIKGDSEQLDSQKQLAQISNSEFWWARLYIAEILRRNPELRTPELVKALQADTNDYVKAAVASWTKDKKETP